MLLEDMSVHILFDVENLALKLKNGSVSRGKNPEGRLDGSLGLAINYGVAWSRPVSLGMQISLSADGRQEKTS